MKIILARENANDDSLQEQAFDREIIYIGRDVDVCQIVFDRKTYPMVSRRHAELRFAENKWFLHDSGSSYGTFIDGQKIAEPLEIKIGQRIQFGVQGPILRVVHFDIHARQNFSDNNFQNVPTAAENSVARKNLSSINSSQIKPNQTAQLEFIDSNQVSEPFKMSKNSVWLGRDLEGDIVFESSAAMVSRRHAEIKREGDQFVLTDNNSFNGTLVNEQRISMPTQLYHDDRIQLGLGGPVLRLNAPWLVAPKEAALVGQRSASFRRPSDITNELEPVGSKTIAVNFGKSFAEISSNEITHPQLLMSLAFGSKQELIIGRSDASDIKLDGLQISNRHARLLQTNSGIAIEDLNSTNGIYINGDRISRQVITPADSVQIGSFLFRIDNANNIGVFDTRSKTRLDAINVTKDVKNRAGGKIRLLDNVSLSIQPNEFVGLLGASGAGKSTLIDALNGYRPASDGNVLINNLDLYRHLDSLKQSIGYVPQEDIIHNELSVYQTLYYVAKLRLSRDVSQKEIKQIIDEVLDVTNLAERRNNLVKQLSGGQRKRVSIAVELITKPSIIFLDEPTSGLDPATEEKIMKLFRQIAESGRTVVLTTHAMENVRLFDKIAVLMLGKLVFYGKPEDALKHFSAQSFKDLFDKLEEPIEQNLKQNDNRQSLSEQTAEEWKRKFTQTKEYEENISRPLAEVGKVQTSAVNKKRRLGIFGSVRQTLTLSRRYLEVLLRDKLNLCILLIQAPVIALLTFLVMSENQPRDFVYFVLSLVSVWFGTSVAAREIVREQAVYKRERMVNLGLLPYIASKLFILGLIVGLQCLLLFIPLKFFDVAGIMYMPGKLFGVPQLWMMLLTAAVGIAVGLLISALVKTSEMATSLVPLVLIPQILFSGLVGVPVGLNKTVGLTMPAAWSFDAIKRFSGLDTLEKEGADPNGETKGLGLYKYIETENEKIIVDAKREIREYKKNSQDKLEDFETELRSGNNPFPPQFDEPPAIADARKLPENLSKYVAFLHPWMNEILNQIVLMLMFVILVIGTLFILRLRDIS